MSRNVDYGKDYPFLVKEMLRFPEGQTVSIKVESRSDAARTLNVRGYTRDGTFDFKHTTNADRSRGTDSFRLPDWPLAIYVTTTSTDVKRGQLYARVMLQVGGFDVQLVAYGYITDNDSVAWPPGTQDPINGGRGFIRTQAIANPAAGAEISFTVETNSAIRLIAIKATLTTSATVGNRRPTWVHDNGTTSYSRIQHGSNQAASLAIEYTYGELGYERTGQDNVAALGSLQDFRIPENHRVRTSTVGLDAADQWSNIEVTWEEWISE